MTGDGDRRPRDRYGRPLPAGSRDRLQADEPAEVAGTLDEAVARGVELFDRRRFFEAHEFFEHAWNLLPEGDAARPFWKAVTQVAVGCCHVQRGNRSGATALLWRAAAGLAGEPPAGTGRAGATGHGGGAADRVDVVRLAAAARELAARVEAAGDLGEVGFFRFPAR